MRLFLWILLLIILIFLWKEREKEKERLRKPTLREKVKTWFIRMWRAEAVREKRVERRIRMRGFFAGIKEWFVGVIEKFRIKRARRREIRKVRKEVRIIVKKKPTAIEYEAMIRKLREMRRKAKSIKVFC